MPVEVGTASCGSAYAEALQDGIPHVAHPVAVLIALEYATRIHHRGIHELRVGVPVPVGDVGLHTSHPHWRNFGVIAIQNRHIDERIHGVVVSQVEVAHYRPQLSGANSERERIPSLLITQGGPQDLGRHAVSGRAEIFGEKRRGVKLYSAVEPPMAV